MKTAKVKSLLSQVQAIRTPPVKSCSLHATAMIAKHYSYLMTAWHSEPAKINQIGVEEKHKHSHPNQALLQIKFRLASIKSSLKVLQEITKKCSSAM